MPEENAPAEPQSGNQPPAAAQQPETPPSWESMFDGEDPGKVKEALDNSRKWEQRAKDNFEKAQQFDQLEEAKKTEEQKLQEGLQKAQEEGRTATSENARLKAILSTLPDEQGSKLLDLAARLQGEGSDELLEDAQRLLSWANPSPPPPSFDGGSRQPSESSDMNSILRRASGRE